jgi:hypothetical protein
VLTISMINDSRDILSTSFHAVAEFHVADCDDEKCNRHNDPNHVLHIRSPIQINTSVQHEQMRSQLFVLAYVKFIHTVEAM